MFGGDEVSAIVMDMGSSCTKSGYAGEDCPKFVIPTTVGVTGGEEAAAQEGASKRTFHVGTNALSVPREGMRVPPGVAERERSARGRNGSIAG